MYLFILGKIYKSEHEELIKKFLHLNFKKVWIYTFCSELNE